MLERCCLTVSANNSYRHATQDIALLTGITVSFKTQERIPQAHDYPEPESQQEVQEISIDGGNVRIIPLAGETSPCWKQFKAVHLAPEGIVGAWFDDNPALVKCLNHQPLGLPLVCLGDGHDGIWNLFAGINPAVQRIEILDWYHLMENLEKVGGSFQRIAAARSLLWKGKVDETIKLFQECESHQAGCFMDYLNHHRHRIPNYEYLQAEEVCSIGSGNIEATVKQIASRVKITGARWDRNNLPKVLAQRSAYLNHVL
jgi:hypothetical protein